MPNDVIVRQLEPNGQKWYGGPRGARSPLTCRRQEPAETMATDDTDALIITDAEGMPFMIPRKGRIEIEVAE